MFKFYKENYFLFFWVRFLNSIIILIIMNKNLMLIITFMLIAFSISFSLALNKSTQKDLIGQAYNYNKGVCIYCTEYCGLNYPNNAGTIVSTTNNFHVKSLEDGCLGELSWAEPNKDILLCCR